MRFLQNNVVCTVKETKLENTMRKVQKNVVFTDPQPAVLRDRVCPRRRFDVPHAEAEEAAGGTRKVK